MLAMMLEAVYCDTALKKIIAIKPRQIFLPLFALCDSLKEKNGLIFLPDFVGIGDPDGIRTHDLHRDRVACLTATPRGHNYPYESTGIGKLL